MADVINLNHARKARARADKAAKAVENRVKHGRTKAGKAADRAQAARVDRDLDGAKRE
ncbi:DUF4169 family protein [Sphingomonas sp.]|uniref:DUF4169 family protein n=1 Tax=Sphingomonas sp. TaxID=28214 RepID=UPI001B2C6813|nr:DUF4169 family protein [Sphingomonas sp.]MBO9714101.1 DUF4169 family protein [Sphingomonas sp.]